MTKLALLDELEKESDSIKSSAPASGQVMGQYAKAKLIDAVADAMSKLRRATIGEVGKYLRDHGFVPKGDNFKISVATTLKRLAARGNLNSQLKGGKRIYWVPDTAARSVYLFPGVSG